MSMICISCSFGAKSTGTVARTHSAPWEHQPSQLPLQGWTEGRRKGGRELAGGRVYADQLTLSAGGTREFASACVPLC